MSHDKRLSEDDFRPGEENRRTNTKALPFTAFSELGDQPWCKLWIIKNVIARNEVSSFFGPPGSGKSRSGLTSPLLLPAPSSIGVATATKVLAVLSTLGLSAPTSCVEGSKPTSSVTG